MSLLQTWPRRLAKTLWGKLRDGSSWRGEKCVLYILLLGFVFVVFFAVAFVLLCFICFLRLLCSLCSLCSLFFRRFLSFCLVLSRSLYFFVTVSLDYLCMVFGSILFLFFFFLFFYSFRFGFHFFFLGIPSVGTIRVCFLLVQLTCLVRSLASE